MTQINYLINLAKDSHVTGVATSSNSQWTGTSGYGDSKSASRDRKVNRRSSDRIILTA